MLTAQRTLAGWDYYAIASYGGEHPFVPIDVKETSRPAAGNRFSATVVIPDPANNPSDWVIKYNHWYERPSTYVVPALTVAGALAGYFLGRRRACNAAVR
jgi:hypothetical protein